MNTPPEQVDGGGDQDKKLDQVSPGAAGPSATALLSLFEPPGGFLFQVWFSKTILVEILFIAMTTKTPLATMKYYFPTLIDSPRPGTGRTYLVSACVRRILNHPGLKHI